MHGDVQQGTVKLGYKLGGDLKCSAHATIGTAKEWENVMDKVVGMAAAARKRTVTMEVVDLNRKVCDFSVRIQRKVDHLCA